MCLVEIYGTCNKHKKLWLVHLTHRFSAFTLDILSAPAPSKIRLTQKYGLVYFPPVSSTTPAFLFPMLYVASYHLCPVCTDHTWPGADRKTPWETQKLILSLPSPGSTRILMLLLLPPQANHNATTTKTTVVATTTSTTETACRQRIIVIARRIPRVWPAEHRVSQAQPWPARCRCRYLLLL